MRHCPECDYKMTALFTSYACDRCDGLIETNGKYSGWVVWDPEEKSDPCLKYVFRYVDHAEKWRQLNHLPNCQIRMVESDHPFEWYIGNGVIKNITLADRLIQVHTNLSTYTPANCRAYLVPFREYF